MINVLFAAGNHRWKQFERPLRKALAREGMEARLSLDLDPQIADYVIYAPNRDFQDFRRCSRAKAVMSLWAGVEDIVTNRTLTQPLTRMVDRSLTEGMVEWVVGHVLRHHLGMDAHIVNPDHAWRFDPPPLARDRNLALLGLGELGSACARALTSLNFGVTGWSRRPKRLDGVVCRYGQDGLESVLACAEILILLLPLTSKTRNLLNSETMALLPEGAIVLNPGRGHLIDDEALLVALDSGRIAHATLDVFREEPLPKEHPFWAHPKVTVTPHQASETRPDSASQLIAENIRRCETGEPMLHIVDLRAGY